MKEDGAGEGDEGEGDDHDDEEFFEEAVGPGQYNARGQGGDNDRPPGRFNGGEGQVQGLSGTSVDAAACHVARDEVQDPDPDKPGDFGVGFQGGQFAGQAVEGPQDGFAGRDGVAGQFGLDDAFAPAGQEHPPEHGKAHGSAQRGGDGLIIGASS